MRFKRVLLTVLFIFTIVLLLGMMPSCNKTPTTTTEQPKDPESGTKTGPKYVAHKGYSSRYLGNTVEAFRAAANLGFYGIETDIRMTKDGYFVCNHDATVEYANGTTKDIATTNRAELLDDPIKNDKTNDDAFLCTFETYLQVCKQGNKIAVIELKNFINATDARKILQVIDAKYDRQKVMFISFYYLSLQAIQEVAPSIPLQYLSQLANDPAFENHCLADNVSIDVKHTILTEELVETFHDAGLEVNVWTVNDESVLQTAYQMGVDYVTTDVFYED